MPFRITPILKGRIKRIDNYLSHTHTDYTYDSEGRLLQINYPYGEKVSYSYHANMKFIEETDRWGYTKHDTISIKRSNMADSIWNEYGVWLAEYDLDQKLTREVYVPVRGKRRRAGSQHYTHTYSYYCSKNDPSSFSSFPCDNIEGCQYLKCHTCIGPKGDTIYNFYYRYLFNEQGKVKTGMEYYSTGQLYDSVGYTYY